MESSNSSCKVNRRTFFPSLERERTDLHLWFPSLIVFAILDLVPQGQCIFDRGDIREVSGVRDAQTSHAVSVSPFLNDNEQTFVRKISGHSYREVTLEGFGTSVDMIAADFTIEIHIQSV